MFCANCGTENADGALFCAGCGSSMTGGAAAPVEPKVEKKSYIGLIRGIAVLAIVAALAVAAYLLLGGLSYKLVAKNYIKYDVAADAAKVYKLVPKKVVDDIKEDMELEDADDWKDWVEDISEGREDAYKAVEDRLGGKLKVSYKISDTQNLKGDELEDIQDWYEEEFDIKVKAAKVVEFDVELKGRDDKEEYTVEITLIQVGLFWYVDIYSTPNILR